MVLKCSKWFLVTFIALGVVTHALGAINPELTPMFSEENGLAVNVTGWLFSIGCWGVLLSGAVYSAVRPQEPAV